MAFEGGILILPGDGTGAFGPGTQGPQGIGGMPGTAIDLNADAAADLVIPNRYANKVTVLLSDPAAGISFAARAFLSKSGPTQIGSGGPPYTRLSVEPLAGAYDNSSVNLSTLAMISAGTGEVELIHANRAETRIVGDTDGNGIAEIQVSFSRDDLRRLFSRLQGKAIVQVTIEGLFNTTGSLRAPLELRVNSPEGKVARIYPNPSNPAATLTFQTEKAGAVRVRLFDLHGRLIRTVFEEPLLNAGVHATTIYGFDDSGNAISSGIFFYQIESPGRVEKGRLIILK